MLRPYEWNSTIYYAYKRRLNDLKYYVYCTTTCSSSYQKLYHMATDILLLCRCQINLSIEIHE